MLSKEGERIEFNEPINISDAPAAYQWLNKVENQMRVTMAALLEVSEGSICVLVIGLSFSRCLSVFASQRSIKEQKGFETMPESQQEAAYFAWIDTYPVQISCLATQISWSEAVDDALRQVRTEGLNSNQQQIGAVLKKVEDSLQVCCSFKPSFLFKPWLIMNARLLNSSYHAIFSEHCCTHFDRPDQRASEEI